MQRHAKYPNYLHRVFTDGTKVSFLPPVRRRGIGWSERLSVLLSSLIHTSQVPKTMGQLHSENSKSLKRERERERNREETQIERSERRRPVTGLPWQGRGKHMMKTHCSLAAILALSVPQNRMLNPRNSGLVRHSQLRSSVWSILQPGLPVRDSHWQLPTLQSIDQFLSRGFHHHLLVSSTKDEAKSTAWFHKWSLKRFPYTEHLFDEL